jgi:hypothetical protein
MLFTICNEVQWDGRDLRNDKYIGIQNLERKFWRKEATWRTEA